MAPFSSRGIAAMLALIGCAAAQPTAPRWIWHPTQVDTVHARREFTVSAPVRRATLWATGDNHLEVWLNGTRVLQSDTWEQVDCIDVTESVQDGDNVLALRGRNDGGPAGVALRLSVVLAGGVVELVSDQGFRCAAEVGGAAWQQPSFVPAGWQPAAEFGVAGATDIPWSTTVGATDFCTDATAARAQLPAPATDLTVAEGFRVEKLYDVPRATQGSWVSLTTGPGGTLIACDQRGKGLFRIEPARLAEPDSTTQVEHIDLAVSHAQGLQWAYDSLYVVQNGPDSGLYRIRDDDGDGALDHVEQLTPLAGSGEHGPHAVILSPDGQSLYIACGNHTDLPVDAIARSRAPMDWAEDLLLPRMWDARGHARGRLAPGGFICKVDPDGKLWEVIATGFRNEYDIAFSPEGELFTCDADMEWDMGMPWYRPTRICHVVSGAEFGWRAGTGKWPNYFADSVPAAVDIGPGSPTGLVFGAGSAFPEPYQSALFALDWTFGTIWAAHLSGAGAGFQGYVEPFLTGAPLPVTDAVIGDDGALYFITGGRGLQSHLYRVASDGHASARPAESKPPPAARRLRRRLERLHGAAASDVGQAVDEAWPALGHRDRLVRYAARLALEAQPVTAWATRACSEPDPLRAAHVLLALARRGPREQQPALLAALREIPLDHPDDQVVLTALRAFELACLRQGPPGDVERARLINHLDPAVPSGRAAVDIELIRLLVYLRAPSVVGKALALMRSAEPTPAPEWSGLIERNDEYGGPIRRMLQDMPPLRRLRFALMLRNVRDGWTRKQRREYFGFLNEADQHAGGESYRGFIEMIRNEALAQCTAAERAAVAELLAGGTGPSREPPALIALTGPARAWTVDAATSALGSSLRHADYERGRALFFTVSCATCHRFDGEGGQIGPDLTSAGNKFGLHDLLEATLEPSRDISDQYGSAVVTKKDGSSVFGRVVTREDGNLEVYLPVSGTPPIVVPEDQVQSVDASPLSQMPAGLVNMLGADDLKHLMAFLLSRANGNDGMFR